MSSIGITRRVALSAAGTWLLPAFCQEPPAGKPAARLGIVTDIHSADKAAAGTRFYRDSLAKLGEAVDAWNRERVDAVIELGDLVDALPTVEQEMADLHRALGVLRKSSAPAHFVLGNHCVWTLTKEQFLNEWGATRSWYSFRLSGYRVVVLDSAFTSDGQPYGGREFDWRDAFLPADQLEWLRGELAASADPALVLMHHRADGDDHYNVRNAAELRGILEASGRVAAVFQGHQHVNDHRMIGGIHFCTLRSMVDGAGPENSAYGVLELYPGGKLHLRGYRLLESRDLAS